MRRNEKRIVWIDCAKFVAIVAVVVDHCNGVLYTNPYIAYASYYSVCLFILLAGVSTWVSFAKGNEISFSGQIVKVRKLLSAYAVATFIVLCVTQRRFDLVTYLKFLINFNIQGPYYYLVFFMQLLIAAPIMVKWCAFVNTKKHKWVMQFGTIGCLGWFAYVCINYSFILPVHGGGKFGGGGTFMILYYAGMLLAGNGVFIKGITTRLVIMVLSLGLSMVWVVLMAEGKLPFDRWMSPYWGDGFNPPSVNCMVYSLFVLFFCYCAFSLICESKKGIVLKLVEIISLVGRNTLYIWLYHLLIKNMIIKRFPNMTESGLWARLLTFGLIVTLPIILKQLVDIFLQFYRVHIDKQSAVEQQAE